MAEARQYGVDRWCSARLVNDAALDDEAARLGISDRRRRRARPGDRDARLPGPDGKFDREAYTYALERAGLTPRRFEDLLRRESDARAVAAGCSRRPPCPTPRR